MHGKGLLKVLILKNRTLSVPFSIASARKSSPCLFTVSCNETKDAILMAFDVLGEGSPTFGDFGSVSTLLVDLVGREEPLRVPKDIVCKRKDKM